MSTSTNLHELEDATIRYATSNHPSHWIMIEAEGNTVTLHLPAGPKLRHAVLSRLRLALDAADEEAMREVVESNREAMRDPDICQRCTHHRNDHRVNPMTGGPDACDYRFPFVNGAPGIRNCTCWAFTNQPLNSVARIGRAITSTHTIVDD